MATKRKIVFINNGFYHVFNRGIEKRPIFTNQWELKRAEELMKFYQYQNTPIRFSQFNLLSKERQQEIWEIISTSKKLIEIICFCFMPNHFHFLLKQLEDKGVATFIANFTNAYTKYFNTRYQRIGPLFEGVFKAVYVETDEQLIHLSRYIHLNPVSSSLIETSKLENYVWSSYPNYLTNKNDNIIERKLILSFFKSVAEYKRFVLDQASYARELNKIKHKILE
ncbi:transposase [Candidatus Daviesbacteria bacterium]|nr:transposase [Candidatus Daviesbacteria bacterium]